MSTAEQPESIGVYVHIPYCVSKCPYCDFNSYAIAEADQPAGSPRRSAILEEQAYTQAVLTELALYRTHPEWNNRRCHSVFFGGGTPSLFSERAIGTILTAIADSFVFDADCEVTLEANPGTVSEALGVKRLSGFRSAGVNRLSFGVQSFDVQKLRFLGRLHGVDDIRRSLDNASAAEFDNFNLDLIYGVAGESHDSWQRDLELGLQAGAQHISAYCLTIEPGTDFEKLYRKGLFKELAEGDQADLFVQTQTVLREAGYEQYEISNFARPGKACRHNLGYWNWSDYLALGAGAHSFVKVNGAANAVARRWSNIPKPSHYVERARAGGDCSQRREEVDSAQAQLEYLLCHLRTAEGIIESKFYRYFGLSFHQKYAEVLMSLAAEQLVDSSSAATKVTSRGFLFVDEVLSRLAAQSLS